MVAAGVVVHLFPSSSGRHCGEASGESLPGLVSVSTTAASSDVVVLLGGVLLGCFLLGLWLLGENLSPVLRRSNDGGTPVPLGGVALEVLGPASPVVVCFVGRR